MSMTKVIFRKFEATGDIIALFPEIPADCKSYMCLSYMFVGQHGAASPAHIVRDTKPAIDLEYALLQDELERVVGYGLSIIKRFQYKHLQTRTNTVITEALKKVS